MAKSTVAIGLDIGTATVKVSEINISRREPVLTNLAVGMLPEGTVREGEIVDSAAVSASIRELWKTAGIRKKKVILGIANQKVIVRPMDLPYMEEEELENAVRYQVQEFIPIPIDDAIIDYEVVDEFLTGEDERMQTILLAAAHRDMISQFVDTVTNAGLVPEAIELKAFAMSRSLIKKEFSFLENGEAAPSPGSVCMINIGSGICNICVEKNNTPRFVRMLMLGGDYFTNTLVEQMQISPAEAEEIKLGRSQDEKANALLLREVQSFVGEIRRSLEYHISQSQERDLTRIILSGSGSRMINLPVELNRGLKLPIEIGRPLQNVELGKLPYSPEHLAELEASIAVCVGLALRDTEE